MKKAFFSSNYSILSSLLFLLVLSSCSQIGVVSFDKKYSNIDFVLPSPQPAGTVIIEKEIETDLVQFAKDNNFNIDKIESATLKSVTLTINDTDPTPVTFNVVDAIACEFSVDGNAVLEVGDKDIVQSTSNVLNLDTKGVDIAPYLKATKFKLKLILTTNAPITHDVPMNASIDCSFKVKPLK